jgi:hypothetical protein
MEISMPDDRGTRGGLRVAGLILGWLAVLAATIASWTVVALEPPDLRSIGWLLLGVAIGYAIRR